MNSDKNTETMQALLNRSRHEGAAQAFRGLASGLKGKRGQMPYWAVRHLLVETAKDFDERAEEEQAKLEALSE